MFSLNTAAILENLRGSDSVQILSEYEFQKPRLAHKIRGSRWLVAGGAGSIGAAFIEQLFSFQPEYVSIVDPDENRLAELVRDLRNRYPGEFLRGLRTYSIGLGDPWFEDWLRGQPTLDYVASFAARKHVRAERDPWSAQAMLFTNVTAHTQFLETLTSRAGDLQNVFIVSTDKAADPLSLMGASKRLLEKILFGYVNRFPVSTSRFANVLFSAGSLSEAFLFRLQKKQPIAFPEDIQRYMISREEGAAICLMVAVPNSTSAIVYPKDLPRHGFLPLAKEILSQLKLTGKLYALSEHSRALDILDRNLEEGYWPLIATNTQTGGEKDQEIFFEESEIQLEFPIKCFGAVQGSPLQDTEMDFTRPPHEWWDKLPEIFPGFNLPDYSRPSLDTQI